jgi:hypothetical protein
MNAPVQLSVEDLMQGQMSAYNAQDLDAYAAFFKDDVVVGDYNGQVAQRSYAELRARYEKTFAQFPENKAELLSRMIVGNTVVEHERVVRAPGGETFDVICIYTLADGRIARVDFAK